MYYVESQRRNPNSVSNSEPLSENEDLLGSDTIITYWCSVSVSTL